MHGFLASGLELVTKLLQITGVFAAAVAATWIIGKRDRYTGTWVSIVLALMLTAFLCLTVAFSPYESSRQGLLEALSNLGWLLVVWRLFAGDGRHTTVTPIRPVVLVLAALGIMQIGLELAASNILEFSSKYAEEEWLRLISVLRLLSAIGGLMLLHNLYLGASNQARLVLRWPALGLAALWAFDLNFYAIAYLGREWPAGLAAIRGVIVIGLAILMALGGAKGQESIKFHPSRKVAFQSASLLVIAGYLTAMVAGANWIAYAGGNAAKLVQVSFLIAAVTMAAILLPSRKLRGWLKIMLIKHLFQHRYDYRAEWMRFTRTMAKGDGPVMPLEERAVQAIADIADSPAGLLLMPDDKGELTLAARWQWPLAEVPAVAMDTAASSFFEQSGLIVDLDDLRSGKIMQNEADMIPQWLSDDKRAWALVPLIHERLTGLVVLARPTPARKFDWEDFDLLRVAGQQLASYLAEHTLQAALIDASRFDDFHRRIAFVMHDIKNLASQLSLLARNAEIHADNPAFRADMLVTLRNSAEKLNTLLARLSRYVSGGVDRQTRIDLAETLQEVASQFLTRHPVIVKKSDPCAIIANAEAIEQVLVHLVQNAIDASASDAPVELSLLSDEPNARIDILDSGTGMSADFVRNKLFKPFVSTKQGGFGIGAFEASELIKTMQGRLEVESREGWGSRFIIRIPLADAHGLIKKVA